MGREKQLHYGCVVTRCYDRAATYWCRAVEIIEKQTCMRTSASGWTRRKRHSVLSLTKKQTRQREALVQLAAEFTLNVVQVCLETDVSNDTEAPEEEKEVESQPAI